MGRNRDDYKTAKGLTEEDQAIENLSLDAEEVDLDNETPDLCQSFGREYFDISEYE